MQHQGLGEVTERTDEMDDRDLRSRVVSLEHHAQARDQRLTTLEQWRQQTDIADARKDEQFKHIDERFSTIDSKIESVHTALGGKIDAVNSTLSWIGKLVIGSVVLAIIAFMINGGLQLPT